jgi:hypothetical protein
MEKEERKLLWKTIIEKHYRKGWWPVSYRPAGFMVHKGHNITLAIMEEAYLDQEQFCETGLSDFDLGRL